MAQGIHAEKGTLAVSHPRILHTVTALAEALQDYAVIPDDIEPRCIKPREDYSPIRFYLSPFSPIIPT
jgi:hypothetical protein